MTFWDDSEASGRSGGYRQWIDAARRQVLREFGAQLTSHREIRGCGRKVRKGRPGSSREILYANYSCRHKWLCPTCGYTASRKQAAKLKRRLRSWTADGGATAFLTLTQSHCPNDGLAMQWSRGESGWESVVRRPAWVADTQTYGIRGYIRITEVVHNPATGWHVHFHVILFLDRALDQSRLEGLRASLAKRFVRGVARAGGDASADFQHLAPGRPGTEEILANYCFKGTTGRTSRDGSRTPIAILDHLESTGEGRPVWDEFTTTVTAQRRMQITPSSRIDEMRPRGHYSCYTGD